MYNLFHVQRWTDPEARREIHESLIRELARGALPAEAEALVLDGLITDGLVFSEPLLRSRLDAWSSRAIEIAPDVRTLRGSRGAVLVELGRYQEGRNILEALIAETGLRPFDHFMSKLYLAHAALVLGDVDTAQDSVAAASSIDLGEIAQPFAAEMIARFMARRDASAGERLAG